MVVVFFHTWLFYFPHLANRMRPTPIIAPRYGIEAVLGYEPFSVLYSGEAAVSVFFVLSGYVLTKKFYETQDARLIEQAAVKRYFRLALPCLGSVVIAWLILVSVGMGAELATRLGVVGWELSTFSGHLSFANAIGNGLVGAPLLGDPSFNPPLWTLSIELIGSMMLFACYGLIWRHSRMLTIFWLILLANYLGGHGTAVVYYAGLFAGSLLNLATRWLEEHPRVGTGLVLFGLLTISVDNTHDFRWLRDMPIPNFSPYGPRFYDDPVLFWQMVAAFSLVAGTIGCQWFAAALSTRGPTHLGRLSFSIYVLHYPLLNSVMLWAMHGCQRLFGDYLLSAAASYLIYLVTLFLAAELFWRFIDGPSIAFSAWIADRSRRDTPAPAARGA